MGERTGLVLTGGGARGAYQAGVLLALSEILGARELPFPVLSGASAGSLSAAFLAGRAGDFRAAARELFDLWATVRLEDVFRTDAATMLRIGADWAADLSLGGWIGTGRGRSLLDTAPLGEYLRAHVDPDAIATHVAAGLVRGLGITATNYHTGLAVTFFAGDPEIQPWARTTRVAVRDRITVDHVRASAAIPFFFPAVCIRGEYYADGCVRLHTPLSPAIHMGAERVLAIGVRYPRAPTAAEAPSPALPPPGVGRPYPTSAETAGVLLNAMLLDALESDLERMERINRTVQLIPGRVLDAHAYPLRHIPVKAISPSQDLGTLAMHMMSGLPYMLRHLLHGLGASDQSGWDLLSYLAFDRAYTTRLLDLGYEDGISQRNELRAFLG